MAVKKKTKPPRGRLSVAFTPCVDKGDCTGGRVIRLPLKVDGIRLRRCPFCDRVHAFRPARRGVPSKPVYVGRYETSSEAINAALAPGG